MSKVAVLLSTYNGEFFLRDFLNSLCEQNYKNFDVIVRDDGSVDQTLKILKEYTNILSLTMIPESNNLGPARSFFKILNDAGSSYTAYMFADQDDWWAPEKILRCINHLQSVDNNNIPTLYFSSLELVDENLQHLCFTPSPNTIGLHNALVENIATGCTIGINSQARLLALKSVPKSFTMHDWWLYILLSALGNVFFDPVPTIKYRQHSSNTIGGASSFLVDYKRRFLRFFKRKKTGVFMISDQAQSFLDCYGNLLSDELCRMVEILTPSRKGIFTSMRLFLFSPFSRQRKFDDLILRVIFLLRRY